MSTSKAVSANVRAVFFDFSGVLERGSRPNDAVVDLADHLSEHYRIGVISNALESLEAHLRNGWGSLTHFDSVITSGRTGLDKPFPLIFLHAAEAVGLSPQSCVHIDDSPSNVGGAREAGFQAVLYNGEIASLERELRELGIDW